MRFLHILIIFVLDYFLTDTIIINMYQLIFLATDHAKNRTYYYANFNGVYVLCFQQGHDFCFYTQLFSNTIDMVEFYLKRSTFSSVTFHFSYRAAIDAAINLENDKESFSTHYQRALNQIAQVAA